MPTANAPVPGSMRTLLIPGGMSKGCSGTSFSATRMKSIQIGSAAFAPNSPWPSEPKSSNPTQQLATSLSPSKPVNQASR